MAFIKRAFALAVVAVAVVPFAVAHNQPQNTAECQNQNGKGWFFHEPKQCCLPTTPPARPPSPPSGKSCPSHGWYWGADKGCCLPTTPQPPHNPPPQCNPGHGWQPSLQCCTPHNPTPPSNPPKPSSKPGQGGYGNNGHGGYGNHKRAQVARSIPECPKGLSACPIPGLTPGDIECLDTTVELESCGGCASIGKGQNCAAIEGAWNVGCESNSCRVYSCEDGYTLSPDNTSCVKA
jgi:hypothetical protein